MALKVLIDSNIPFLQKALENEAETKLFYGKELTKDIIKNFGADMLFVRSTVKANSDLLSGTKVRFIATATSGTDHFDNTFLDSDGIVHESALGSNANSVAEWVVYNILSHYDRKNRSVAGVNLGVIGYGCVGKLLAKYAARLGMKVFVNDPPLKDNGFEFPDNVVYAELNDLLDQCEVISNHVPLQKSGSYATKLLIDEPQFQIMKNDILFVHASRGGVVAEKALFDRVSRGKLTAMVDVWENEPNVEKEAISLAKVATPHVAGHSLTGKIRGSIMMAEVFERFTSIKPDYSIFTAEMAHYVPLPEKSYSEQSVLDILREMRKIEQDSKQFKDYAQNSYDEIAKNFELMRKNYPIRFESL